MCDDQRNDPAVDQYATCHEERKDFGIVWKPNHAFGVDPVRHARFSLRQARYDAAASDIDALAQQAAVTGNSLTVLDMGCSRGTLLRHLEHRPNFAAIRLDGADIVECEIYKRTLYRDFFRSDLMAGCPEIPSNEYDVVVCEQVLEHLKEIELAIKTLERILKPDGTLIVGVPIFVPPLALVRRLYVACTLAIDPTRYWSHIQTFSLRTFLRAFRRDSHLRLFRVRGFRIVSEGLLMPLENRRWWWKLNRRIGECVPWACIEVQAILTKPLASDQAVAPPLHV